MANYIESFTDFITENGPNACHDVTIEYNGNTKLIQYRELSSKEETSALKEFEDWFKGNYGKEDRDRTVGLQQYRYFKMIKPFANDLETFDDFIKLPRTLIGAIVTAIEENLLERYPHLKRQLKNQLSSLLT